MPVYPRLELLTEDKPIMPGTGLRDHGVVDADVQVGAGGHVTVCSGRAGEDGAI